MSVLHLDSSNFEKTVSESEKPVIVDFWAEWCMPCKMFSPIVEQAAAELGDRAVVAKLNVDESADIAMKYSVASIPTVIVFRDGKEATRAIGARSKDEVIGLLDM